MTGWKDKYKEMIPYIEHRATGYVLYFQDPDKSLKGEYLTEAIFSQTPLSPYIFSKSERCQMKVFESPSKALCWYTWARYDQNINYNLKIKLGARESYCIAQVALEALELVEFDQRLNQAHRMSF